MGIGKGILISTRGDLWGLGDHRLLCGDATDSQDVRRLLGIDVPALILTDPPYGVNYVGGAKKHRKLTGDQSGQTAQRLYDAVFEAVPFGSPAILCWHADKAGSLVRDAAETHGYQPVATIVWVKNHARFLAGNARYHAKHEPLIYCVRKGQKHPKWCGPNNETTVWEAARAHRNDYHPTQKPVPLALRAIRNHTDEGDFVLDLYGGGGSTLIACEDSGRTCLMMELDPIYVDVICKRFQATTGTLPVRDGMEVDFGA